MGFNYVNPRDLKRKVTHYSNSETIPQSSKHVTATFNRQVIKKAKKDSLRELKVLYVGKYIKKTSWLSDSFKILKIIDIVLDYYDEKIFLTIDFRGNEERLSMSIDREFITEEEVLKLRTESLKQISI